MTNTKSIFRNVRSAAFILGIAIAFSSCNNAGKSGEDTKAVADEHNNAKYDSSDTKKDAEFLVEATEINLKEIKLGQLAQQEGTIPEVRNLGKMMIDAHTNAQNEIEGLAAKKQISLPDSITDKGKEAYAKLREKKIADFDKAYCDMMVKGHEKAIEKFEKAAADCKDTEIKAWAKSMLPTLRDHLDLAMTAQKKCEKK